MANRPIRYALPYTMRVRESVALALLGLAFAALVVSTVVWAGVLWLWPDLVRDFGVVGFCGTLFGIFVIGWSVADRGGRLEIRTTGLRYQSGQTLRDLPFADIIQLNVRRREWYSNLEETEKTDWLLDLYGRRDHRPLTIAIHHLSERERRILFDVLETYAPRPVVRDLTNMLQHRAAEE